ncbi:MAG TPA: uroporphyrinogen-III C-methyltransferase [Methylibium sp.]|uniref:uroporphyrinogen-III C-methyltransferase n=1 Tax=Methylibium sp. TaxID=2067992 RepID=UPI002DB98059|nr:uroporphyrinogen-III C-methyltransferase [Methylibium sp.]HEU4458570.1 uroporphyrinogen-III C-methyltransferase [Methylibium sp.]
MNEPAEATPQPSAASALPIVAARIDAAARRRQLVVLLGIVALVLAAVALAVAWQGQQRLQLLEQELVRRQQESANLAAQAKLLADQSQVLAREAVAKATLLDTRVAEVGAQRGQVDELIQSLSRSRDENVVADLEAGVRVALQQTAITGSATPLVAALKSADERLQRLNQPRLEAARRAIGRDLERIKAASVADIASLAIKLDEAVRLVDELPLLVPDAATVAARAASAPKLPPARGAASPPPAASAASGARPWWPEPLAERWRIWSAGFADELRALVRVTRIDQPQAMLLAPEQAWFLRENLKLRLLNARLALLSRQFDAAQADVQAALAALEAHFDRGMRKTMLVAELLRGVAQQAKQAAVPRPDETLATLAAAGVGR